MGKVVARETRISSQIKALEGYSYKHWGLIGTELVLCLQDHWLYKEKELLSMKQVCIFITQRWENCGHAVWLLWVMHIWVDNFFCLDASLFWYYTFFFFLSCFAMISTFLFSLFFLFFLDTAPGSLSRYRAPSLKWFLRTKMTHSGLQAPIWTYSACSKGQITYSGLLGELAERARDSQGCLPFFLKSDTHLQMGTRIAELVLIMPDKWECFFWLLDY